MTTTKIIPANEFAEKLGIPTTAEIILAKEEIKKELKNSLIEEINKNLEKYKFAPVTLTKEHCKSTKLTREELVAFGKQFAKEFKKAGYLIHEYEYKSSNKEKYYSFDVCFKNYNYDF